VLQSQSVPVEPEILAKKVEVAALVAVEDEKPSAPVSLKVESDSAEPVKSAEDRKRALLAAKRLKAEMLLQQQMLEEAERTVESAEIAKEAEVIAATTPPSSVTETIASVEPEPVVEIASPSEAAPQEQPQEVIAPTITDQIVAENQDASPSAVSMETKPTSVSADMLKSFGSSMAKRNKLFAKK
jgi:hypothetical protein